MNALSIFEQMRNRNFEEASRLLNAGFDINGVYFENGTFLYQAIAEGNYEIVHFLLEHGANPNLYFYGMNSLSFLNFTSRRDVLILEELLNAGAWLLPMNTYQQTLMEVLDAHEYQLEETLGTYEDAYEAYTESGNVDEEKDDEFQSYIIKFKRELSIVRDMISMVRPLAETNLLKLMVEVSGTSSEMEVPIDKRATVFTLKSILNQFYFDDSLLFDLVYPAFHLKDKRILEDDRALSDYGLRTGSKVSIVVKISSERHWNAEGGKRKYRVKKTHKNQRGKKLNRKTRKQ